MSRSKDLQYTGQTQNQFFWETALQAGISSQNLTPDQCDRVLRTRVFSTANEDLKLTNGSRTERAGAQDSSDL